MKSVSQFSLFSTFLVVTVFGVLFSVGPWIGYDVGIIVVVFLLFVAYLRRQIQKVGKPILCETSAPPNPLRKIECVIAGADNGIVDVHNSCVQYLPAPVENDDLATIADHRDLKWLILDNTNVNDAGLSFLYGLSKLRRLYVRRSKVTADGLKRLQLFLPNLEVLH